MDRPGKKQMAYVGAIYTQARFPRTAEDVIDEVRRRKRAKDRPEPQHKHVWARMTQFLEGDVLPAAPMLFLEMVMECYWRNPDEQEAVHLCHGWGTPVMELGGRLVPGSHRNSGSVSRDETTLGRGRLPVRGRECGGG